MGRTVCALAWAWAWAWAALHLGGGSRSLVRGFATELTRSHCEDRKFAVGEMIMGSAVKLSGEKTILAVEAVTGERIANASFYSNPEKGDLRVKVWLEPKVFQFALQVTCWGCYFEEGKCNRRNRSNKANDTLIIPAGFEGPVEVLALWGKTYGEVYLAEPLRFQQAAPEEHDHHAAPDL